MLRFKAFLLEKKDMSLVSFNRLTIADLRKDENRVLTFIAKVKEGKPFATMKDTEVVVNKSQADEVEAFMTADNGFPKLRTSMKVKTSTGEFIIPTGFKKTGEFGGRGQGSGTAAETLAMNYFNDKLRKLLDDIDMPSIDLSINGRTVECAEMVKTEGKYEGKEPKSDMTIVDTKGNPVAYISHKAGRSAKDFQQYGGLTYRKAQSNIELKKFMNDLKKMRPDGLNRGENFYRPIKNLALKNQAIYGPEFGGEPSINNVDEFHLGNMNLTKKGNSYKITSTHAGTNGDIARGEYEAVFNARYQGKRSPAKAAGIIVPNCRVAIFPIGSLPRTKKLM